MHPQALHDQSGKKPRRQPWQMAAIAAFSQNITIGCLYGSFGVLMASVESRLSISRELSSMALSLVTVGNSIISPVIGVWATRYSLRLLFLLGAVLSVLGYALLAATHSFVFYLVAYGLLLAPGMALSAVVLPSTLITRWFAHSRGRVLGLVHMPIVITFVPVLSSILLSRHGTSFVYVVSSVCIALILVPLSLVVVDHPDDAPLSPMSDPVTRASLGSLSAWEILCSWRFWALGIPTSLIITSTVVLNTHLIPIAGAWGMSTTAGATLLSMFAFAGIPGSIIWGWIADKVGGGVALCVCAASYGILWLGLLKQPGFSTALLLITVLGLHGPASVPLIGTALSEAFGQQNFSRAYGFAMLMTLPFTVIGIQTSSAIFVRTGSYSLMIITLVAALFLVAPLAYLARRVNPRAPR